MSRRGEVVDFDRLKIKEQILNTPKNDAIKNRERFIDKKRRRTSRGSIDKLLEQQQQNEATVRESLAKQKTDANTTTPVADEHKIIKKD